MNRLLTLLLALMLMLPLGSCEKNDVNDIDYSTPATQTDILGSWINHHNSYTTTLQFTLDSYSIEVINPFNPDVVLSELGTYTFEDGRIELTPDQENTTSQYTYLEPYCENEAHTVIFFKPIGRFEKAAE